LIAVSPRVKQYSAEVLAAVLLALIGIWFLEEFPSKQKLLASFFCGIVVPWFSFSAVFVLAGLVSVCIIYALQKRDWALFRRTLIAFSGGGISVSAILILVSRFGGEKKALVEMWSPNFLPWRQPQALVPWLWDAVCSLSASHFRSPGPGCCNCVVDWSCPGHSCAGSVPDNARFRNVVLFGRLRIATIPIHQPFSFLPCAGDTHLDIRTDVQLAVTVALAKGIFCRVRSGAVLRLRKRRRAAGFSFPRLGG
jgi:hypothetical protein